MSLMMPRQRRRLAAATPLSLTSFFPRRFCRGAFYDACKTPSRDKCSQVEPGGYEDGNVQQLFADPIKIDAPRRHLNIFDKL